MFSKKKRVTKDLFQAIIKQGKTLSSPLFVFRYIPQDKPQYAFVAPKGVAKKAVDRNYLRRKGYSALRSYPVKNYAGIFFYKKGTIKTPFKDIKQDIGLILEKLK